MVAMEAKNCRGVFLGEGLLRFTDRMSRGRNTMSDHFGELDWEDWAIIGSMSEDIANEEREIEKARRDTFGENYLEPEDPAADMDD